MEELSVKTIKRALDELVDSGQVVHEGERRWRRYRLRPKGQTEAESKAGR
jgi:ATP-dependent DNA helicase RecG